MAESNRARPLRKSIGEPGVGKTVIVGDLAQRVAAGDVPKDFLAKEGYDPAYGARPLKRAISRLVIDPIARRLLTGEIKDGGRVSADVGTNGRVFRGASLKQTATH